MNSPSLKGRSAYLGGGVVAMGCDARLGRAANRRRGVRWRIAVLAIFLVAVVAPAPARARAAGTWSIVASPNRSGQAGNVVNGVSCVSADWCVAVGAYTNGI